MRGLGPFKRTYWTETVYYGDYTSEREINRASKKEGYLMSSLCEIKSSGVTAHAPTIDADYPVTLRQSSHKNLLLFTRAGGSRKDCQEFINTMVSVGIIRRKEAPKVLFREKRQKHWDEQVALPELSIGVSVQVLPSTTKNHFHVFFDQLMSWESYKHLLQTMEKVRVIDSNFCHFSIRHRMSMVLKPGLARTPREKKIYIADDPGYW